METDKGGNDEDGGGDDEVMIMMNMMIMMSSMSCYEDGGNQEFFAVCAPCSTILQRFARVGCCPTSAFLLDSMNTGMGMRMMTMLVMVVFGESRNCHNC